MGLPLTYPSATLRMSGGRNRDGLGFGEFKPRPAGMTMGIIFHTTETAGVPGYLRTQSDGSIISVAPHLTLDIANKRWVQDVQFDKRAGTLQGTSTTENDLWVPTNAAWVVQVELACYSDSYIAKRYGRQWVGNLPDEILKMIAEFILWVQSFEPAPQVWYPKTKVTSGKQAMPHASWWPNGPRTWGIAEHVTAPDASSHWDCGAIDSARIMELVRGEAPPAPAPRVKPSDATIDHLVRAGLIGPPADYWKKLDPNDPDWARFNRAVQGGFIRRMFDLGVAQPPTEEAIQYWLREVDPARLPDWDNFWAAVNKAGLP